MPIVKVSHFVGYSLHRVGDRWVRWDAPDGNTYRLDALNPPASGTWRIVLDVDDKPVMGWRTRSNDDDEIVVSLEGAPSIMATLSSNEDDFPKKYYFATDGGNNNPLGRHAFILRVEGYSHQCPVDRWAHLVVMVAG